MSAPMAGPPIGVEPWKATNQRDMTRPRMAGSAVSCRVELPVDMKVMLAAPARESAASSNPSVGATVARAMATPNPVAAIVSGLSPVLPLAAMNRPPMTAPTPMAAVMKPNPVAPTCRPRLAITGRETWNS
jgi:hypothetical protein